MNIQQPCVPMPDEAWQATVSDVGMLELDAPKSDCKAEIEQWLAIAQLNRIRMVLEKYFDDESLGRRWRALARRVKTLECYVCRMGELPSQCISINVKLWMSVPDLRSLSMEIVPKKWECKVTTEPSQFNSTVWLMSPPINVADVPEMEAEMRIALDEAAA